MKMLYSKPSWSCAATTDLLAPSAKFQITGRKVVFAMPLHCVTSTLSAESPSTPPTIAALSTCMLNMSSKDFETAGGFCVWMGPGDFLWIPENYLVAEFNTGRTDLGQNVEVSTSLTWVAMTEFNCSTDACRFSTGFVQSILNKCCEPSQKHLEDHLKACSVHVKKKHQASNFETYDDSS